MADSELRLGASGAWRGEIIATGRLRRAAPLVRLAAGAAAGTALVAVRGRCEADAAEFHAQMAERYVRALGRSKGVLMKAGQALSLALIVPAVPDEFRSIYQEALARLRTEAPPMGAGLVRLVLERELGRRVERVFAEFDWQPLAAASIGQVHAARLRDGRVVAVKVQYPAVAEAIAADLQNLELLATFLSLLMGLVLPRRPRIDARGTAREIGLRVTEELDYRLEAANQARFAACYRGHPFIHVPEVIAELCTQRVLTQELVQGQSWLEAVAAGQDLRDRWGEVVWRFLYGSHARFRVLHADLHPGNCVFHGDGSVSFLDFGCVKRFRRGYAHAISAIGIPCANRNVLGTSHAAVEYGIWLSSAPVTQEEMYAFWRHRLDMYCQEQPFTVTPEYAVKWTKDQFATSGPTGNARQHISAPPEYTVLARVETALVTMMAQLHATNDWRAIAAEYFENALPTTEVGERDRAFFHGRAAAGAPSS